MASSGARREAMVRVVARVQAHDLRLSIKLRPDALLEAAAVANHSGGALLLEVTAALERRGSEMKLVVGGTDAHSSPDPALVKAIARGHAWFEELAAGRATTIAEIAKREDVTDRYVNSLLKLAFLRPELVHVCLLANTTALSAARGRRAQRPL